MIRASPREAEEGQGAALSFWSNEVNHAGLISAFWIGKAYEKTSYYCKPSCFH